MPAFSVGDTTSEPSLSDKVQRYVPRTFRDRSKNKGGLFTAQSRSQPSDSGPSETLASKCIKVVIDNFAEFPVHENIPAKYLSKVTKGLSVDLDADIAAEFIFDENYWKRRCLEVIQQQNCQISQHGLMWKQLFLEKYVQKALEDYEPAADGSDSMGAVLKSVSSCQDYVFTLTIRQLLAHPDLEVLIHSLPNLTKLDLTYGVKKIGMKYDRLLFGMKISDANCLAKCFVDAENLTTLVLQSNLIDDDLLRMLMTGLIKNTQITHLDFSHNKITNHGVRLLAKLLGPDSVLTNLSLADNQIHAEGGRYLGRAIRDNDSLNHLNLRLNRLVDDGGRMLLEGMGNNSTITNLNLSANSLGSDSAASLAVILKDGASPLQSLDVSCNQFVNKDVEDIADALASNKMICSLDLRMNATQNDADVLERIGAIIHRNELYSQKSMDS